MFLVSFVVVGRFCCSLNFVFVLRAIMMGMCSELRVFSVCQVILLAIVFEAVVMSGEEGTWSI